MSLLAAVIRGYQQLGREQVDEWASYGKSVNRRANSGNYTSDMAVQDAVEGVRLAGWGWFSLVSEGLDAIAILSKGQAAKSGAALTFGPYTSPRAGASLALTADPRTPNGNVIPAGQVSFLPTPLPGQETDFVVQLPNAAWRSGSYRCQATATLFGQPAEPFTFKLRLG